MQKGTHPAAYAAQRVNVSSLSSPDVETFTLSLPRGDVFCSPPRRSGRRPGWVVHFVHCQRAAATALTAAVMTLMSIGGIALTSDHTHLVYQRDILKTATDAATLATTRHLWTLGQNLSKEAIDAELMPIARRYILANIPESRRGRATETLVITLTADAGTVDIVTEADLGGAIVGSWMYGKVVQTTRVDSLSDLEIVYGTPTPDEQNIPPPMTELVLAIDITSSMGGRLAGGKKKIDVVKDAAQDLVDTITAGDSSAVAIGLVPWHYRVRFDSGMRQRWENNSWAQYPKSGDPPSPRRYYPYAYKDSYKQIPRSSNSGWYPDPYLETNAGEWRDLPDKGNTSWQGCVDQRRMSGDNPPGISAVPPTTTEPFTMGFYSPTTTYPRDNSISFACRADQWGCFDRNGVTGSRKSAQFNCPSMPTIMPLTTDVGRIKQRISDLGAGGSATYSTLGVVWGHRLLAPAWRDIWSDAAVHPVDAAPNVRKVLVLLTDGDDNHLDQNIVWEHRRQACTAAKNAGIEIISVFAGDPSRGLKDELLQCASPVGEDADEDDTNSFTGSTDEELEGAFEEIGQRLRPLRLMR